MNNPIPKNLQTNGLDDAADITKHTVDSSHTRTHALYMSTDEHKKTFLLRQNDVSRMWQCFEAGLWQLKQKKTNLQNLVHVESDVVVCQCLVKLLRTT